MSKEALKKVKKKEHGEEDEEKNEQVNVAPSSTEEQVNRQNHQSLC